VVVTGRGRAFCAGADLGGGDATFDYGDDRAAEAGVVKEADGRHRDEGGVVALRFFACAKPVIGAINGPAVGVGVTMTLPFDVRLASATARFGLVFARRGLVPEACSSWFLPRVVGISRAMEWCATGRIFGADEALAGGLVRSVHEPDGLLPAAYELATEIATNTSAVSVTVTRALLWRMLGEPHPMGAHRIDSALLEALGRGADVREGVTSFLEKRPPTFPNRVPADLPAPYPWWQDPAF
jgi:enoyl-CoA hydratase/carnithine racemase